MRQSSESKDDDPGGLVSEAAFNTSATACCKVLKVSVGIVGVPGEDGL